MKLFRRMLFVIVFLLVLGMVKLFLTDQSMLVSDDANFNFNLIASGLLVFFVPFILFRRSNSNAVNDESESVVRDDINAVSDDRSLLGIVAIRSIILIMMLIGLDTYINANGVLAADGSMQPDAFAYTFIVFLFVGVLPFLVFYKTPLTELIKKSLRSTSNERKHRPTAYSVNPVNHSEDHVFEKDDYNDTTIRCPYCNSASISAFKVNDPKHIVLQGGLKDIVSLIVDQSVTKNKHYSCLNCNRTW